MSRRWIAECWMGSASGYVDIEVSASTINGAKEQLQNVYGAEQIRNLRQVRTGGDSGSSLPSGSSIWIAGILGAGAAFLYLTPWVLMVIYGGLATWMGEKITNQSVQEYTDTPESETTDNQHKNAMIVFGAALLFGGIGFVHGTFLHKDLMNQYGTSEQVEEVRAK
jgi:hypothetical protein